AVRTQIEFQQSSLDDLLSSDHRVRQVWDYVEELDLSVLYGRVQTTVSSSGRPAIDPAILVSLWLYATLEGVGSARLLDRLCKSDSAYLWLLGGVSVNYHTLSDFRSEAGPVLDELLSQSLTGLIAAGLVDVRTLAVDGMKMQSLASGRSFKSAGRLAELHRATVATVRKLRAEIEEDPAASERRLKARQLAAAEDRERRLRRARKAQAKIEGRREEAADEQRRKEQRKDHKEARASTSDPDARIMKMGDGTYRPAYNVQVKTTVDGAHIVGLSVTDRGADYGLLTPALDEIKRRYGVTPQRALADGGYVSKADIEILHERGVELFCPPRNSKGDPRQPRRGDGPGTIAWRQRMATDQAQAIYRRRFATERPHAHMRNHGLRRLLVRGIDKVKAVVLWHVHAFNFLQFKRLGWV
ncbi:MAG TPA: IS1182 family transposase, partial [Kiloniellaceae bacterium]|nr:IS1182 family transposase [Kiloniellaceae bacterium]